MNKARMLGVLITSAGMAQGAQADITIGSWNLKHLGWNNDKSLGDVAAIAQGADLWALQEVMEEAAVSQLEQRAGKC